MLLELDLSLELNDRYLTYREGDNPIQKFVDAQSDRKLTDWKTNTYSQTLFPVRNNIDGQVCHQNYLDYLELCWASHYGVVLTPDIVWYTLLCELCGIVAEKPETYRSLFTDSPDKKEITVYSDDMEVLPLDSIADALRQLVPNNFADSFLPTFSTSTERSQFAHQAAFADTVSPYYSYSMFCCGIRKVRFEGTIEDWDKVVMGWISITNLFNSVDKSNQVYFSKVDDILSNILAARLGNLDDITDFFKKMFYSERCGSGGETEVYGWFTDLFRVQPKSLRKAQNFASHISLVKYKQLNTGKHYVMKNGVFSSKIVDDMLEPDFAFIAYEDKSQK